MLFSFIPFNCLPYLFLFLLGCPCIVIVYFRAKVVKFLISLPGDYFPPLLFILFWFDGYFSSQVKGLPLYGATESEIKTFCCFRALNYFVKAKVFSQLFLTLGIYLHQLSLK